jgi:ABC-type multidrug transport system ATPase subunit
MPQATPPSAPETPPDPATAARPEPVLRVRHLGFAYPGEPPLFVDWSTDLPPGVTLLDGDMGCGKTTLLRLLAGELPAAAGSELCVRGLNLGSDPDAYRRSVCWFDPRDAAFDELTPAGLLAVQRERHPALDESAWRRHLDAFELAPHLAKPLYALSTGMRRKAGLAIALSAGCAVMLLDEPTGGLDAASLEHLADALCDEPFASRCAVLMVCSRGLEDLPLAGTITLST